MFCFKCGASIPDKTAACPQCGVPVSAVPAPIGSASAAAPAPAPVSPRVNLAQSRVPVGPQETDGKAVGSLILGILAIFPLGLLAGIPAVILGHLSRKSIRESLGRLKGEGMALAGLIMGYMSVAAIPLVLIIAAIAIPSLLRSKMLANESASMSTVRALNTAQSTYSNLYATVGYASSLTVLGPGVPPASCSEQANIDSQHACLVDRGLGCAFSWCIKNGYRYSLTGICGSDGTCTDYVITATPATPASGTKSFCSTADGMMRSRAGAPLERPLGAVEECKAWSPV